MLYKVRCLRKAGRWRAGQFWSDEWVEAELDKAELSAIESDPLLQVKPLKKGEAGELPPVESVQPSGEPDEPEPVMFDDPKLRAKQEKLLREEAEREGRDFEASQHRDLPPPDLGPGSLEEANPGAEVVLRAGSKGGKAGSGKSGKGGGRKPASGDTPGSDFFDGVGGGSDEDDE